SMARIWSAAEELPVTRTLQARDAPPRSGLQESPVAVLVCLRSVARACDVGAGARHAGTPHQRERGHNLRDNRVLLHELDRRTRRAPCKRASAKNPRDELDHLLRATARRGARARCGPLAR